jgi:hypothetical protein
MSTPRGERAYEKYAWILLFVMGVLLTIFGLVYIVMGLFDPPNYEAALLEGGVSTEPLLEQSPPELSLVFGQVLRSWGIFELGFGVFVMAVSYVSFRNKERWSWFVLWILPAAMLAELLNVLRAEMNPGPIPVFLLVSILGLILPYRRFFPASIESSPHVG